MYQGDLISVYASATVATLFAGSTFSSNESSVTFSIPASIASTLSSGASLRTSYTVFKNTLFFEATNPDTQTRKIATPVIDSTVHADGLSTELLPTPVSFEVAVGTAFAGQTLTCVHWDPAARAWSTRGLVTVGVADGKVSCLSFHLTSFAVLVVGSLSLSLSLSLFLSLSLSLSLSLYLSIYLSIYLFIYLSLSQCLFFTFV